MSAELASVTQCMNNEVIKHLRRHHVMILSTSSFTGMPHADTVVYMNDSHSIFFFADVGTPLLRNISDSSRVSFTVDDYTVGWRKVRELQGVGHCQAAADGEEAAAQSLYLAKFGPGATRPAGRLFTIAPHELHFVDHDGATSGHPPQIRPTFQDH